MISSNHHQLADTFWRTHFPDLIDTVLTERQALDEDFWGKLQTAYEASDPDTLWAVLLANIPMRLENSYMFIRITTSAKRTWHKKQD